MTRRPRRDRSPALRLAGGAALVGALALGAPDASAEPASALVMPFDATAGSVSFLVASHPAGSSAGVRTHWAFWDEGCEALAGAIVCLPPDGSVIVDPTAVPATGGTADLSGRRGFATVTAYDASAGCDPADERRGTLARAALVGSFTLADLAGAISFGGPALALPTDTAGSFVDLGAAASAAADVHQSALRLQSFDPADLDVSRVILLALAERTGRGPFRTIEPGPAVTGGEVVRAAARYADRGGASVALPDARLGCATFTSLRRADVPTLLPPGGAGDAVASGGFLALESPRLGDAALGRDTILAGFHAQGVGTFGVLAVGDVALSARATNAPTPTVTPRASSTPTARPSATPTPRATPVASPTPRATASVVAPTSTPGTTVTPAPTTTAPGTTPSPSPSVGPAPTTTPVAPTATPATATPRPTTTAAPTPDVTASPVQTPTPTAVTATPTPARTSGSCGTITIQVRTSYGAPDPGDVSGVAATVTYPSSVTIPGTGSDASVISRVANVSGVSGLFQATDMETQIRAGLISIASPIPAGPFVRVQLECSGGPAPPASAFGCTLEASTLEGTLLPAASCTTEILS